MPQNPRNVYYLQMVILLNLVDIFEYFKVWSEIWSKWDQNNERELKYVMDWVHVPQIWYFHNLKNKYN